MLSALALGLVLQQPAFAATETYKAQRVEGFLVLVSEEAGRHPEELKDGLGQLASDLKGIRKLLRADRLKKLDKVKFWVEWSGGFPGPVFHPSRDWLKEHGHNPEKENCVEIGNLKNYIAWVRTDQPMAILHELAHAYEFIALPIEDHRIGDAFAKAVGSKKYESVEYVRPPKRTAYALTNSHEYFAEITEAYFGRNDFYPFTRTELREFDPEGFRVVQEIWEGNLSNKPQMRALPTHPSPNQQH